MYNAVRWAVTVSLSCVGHFWWMLLCMMQNMLSLGLEMSQIAACDVSSSACLKIKSEFHCVEGFDDLWL